MLAEVSESQWGMITSAQAAARGVSHMNLTRLAESGDLARVSRGVYRDAGAPSDEYEALRAAWLASDPVKLAYERVAEIPAGVVVSGESAAKLHGIGDLRAMRSEFTTPVRKQTQRSEVHYRTRVLGGRDVTMREGLPVTTIERTIADLVEDRNDLSIIGNALRDGARQFRLDVGRLTELLAPLAERNGHGKGDGEALLEQLLRLGGIHEEDLATQVAGIPSLGRLVAAKYLEGQPKVDLEPSFEAFAKQLATHLPPGGIQQHASAISAALRELVVPGLPKGNKVGESLAAIDWAALSLATSIDRQEGSEDE